jgi:hypothetical protein
MSQTETSGSRSYRDPWYAKNRGRALAQYREYRLRKTERLTPDELATCLKNPTLAWTIRGPHWIACLECGALKEQLGHHLRVEHHMTAAEYKQKPAPEGSIPRLSKGASLSSFDVRHKHSRSTKRFQRHHGAPEGFRAVAADPPIEKLLKGRLRSVRSLQARIEMKKTATGRAKPALWGTFRGTKLPKSTPDQQIAAMRLEGAITSTIAGRVSLTRRVVLARLKRMNFPSGAACAFSRGEPLLGKHFLNACEDFKKTRIEMARYMGLKPRNVCYHTSRASLEKPFPAEMGRKFKAGREKLREEFRHQSTKGKDGGHPRLLTQSERTDLPRIYQSLLASVKAVTNWLSERTQRDSQASFEELHQWVYAEARKGRLLRIAFWPEFFDWIQQRKDLRDLLSNTPYVLARDFLAHFHGVSAWTVKEAMVSRDRAKAEMKRV